MKTIIRGNSKTHSGANPRSLCWILFFANCLRPSRLCQFAKNRTRFAIIEFAPRSQFCNSLIKIAIPGLVFIYLLMQVDKRAFKANDHFNVRHVQPSIEADPRFDIPSTDTAALKAIVQQPFYYLAKGCHAFAFVSEDRQYVIKFHRYPSHMRVLPWLNRPFSYQFSTKRKKIKEYNWQRIRYHLENYKNSFCDLKEECGLIYMHPNVTDDLDEKIHLIDKNGNHYHLPLNRMTFILQKRADLLYPTLDRLTQNQDLESAKQVVSSVIELFLRCCQKGYVDEDPILRRNYGVLGTQFIHIDLGDLVYQEEIKQPSNYIPHVRNRTFSLRKRLVRDYPHLVEHYDQEISKLKNYECFTRDSASPLFSPSTHHHSRSKVAP